MRGGLHTQESAQKLYDALASSTVAVTLSFHYHEKQIPAEIYQVSVPVGPGRMSADRLRLIIGIADDHGCDTDLIGNAFLLSPRGNL